MQDERRWSNPVQGRAQGRQLVGSLGQHQDLTSLLKAFENGGCDGLCARPGHRQLAEDSVNGGVCRQRDRCLQLVGDDREVMWSIGRRGGRVQQRSTLHEDDGILPVAACRCCAQSQDILGSDALQDRLEGSRADVVALIDDHLAIAIDERLDLAFVRKGLHHRNVDLAAGLGLAANDGANPIASDVRERQQTLMPLLEQVRAVNQNQRIDSPPGDERRGHDGFTGGGRGAEHTRLMLQHGRDGGFLIGAQLALEVQCDCVFSKPLVMQVRRDLVVTQIGKEPVVGTQPELSGPRARVADEGGAEPSDIARQNAIGEEDPGVCAFIWASIGWTKQILRSGRSGSAGTRRRRVAPGVASCR